MTTVIHEFRPLEPIPVKEVAEFNKILDDCAAYDELNELEEGRGELEERYRQKLERIVELTLEDSHDFLKRTIEVADQRLGHEASTPLLFRALAHIEAERERVLGIGRYPSSGC